MAVLPYALFLFFVPYPICLSPKPGYRDEFDGSIVTNVDMDNSRNILGCEMIHRFWGVQGSRQQRQGTG